MRALVVLGGPMSIGDVGNAQMPYLAKELDLLKRTVIADRSTLAIGFGAQLLAHAAGAKVHPNAKPGATPEAPATPMPEFGWGPVNYPFPGGTEPLVLGMHDGMNVFHWHSDTFELPRLPAPANAPPPPAPPPPTGNALLCSSKACKNQAFRFKHRMFGFQWHPELTPELIDGIVASASPEVKAIVGADAAKRIHQETEKNFSQYARLSDKLLKNFVQFLKVY
jgi:GMP synthase (glutamine-hydrolysing)